MGTVYARHICEENGWDFDDVFKWQFVLNKQRSAPSETWKTSPIGTFWLHHCSDLRCTELVGPDGKNLGFVLGIAIDGQRGSVIGKTCMLEDSNPATVERWIENLAGRFIAFTISAEGPVVYADPTCGLSAMFSAELQTVASNIYLGLDRPISPLPYFDAAQIAKGSNFFFIGETADQSFTQMRANHRLDLGQFKEIRHWPKATRPSGYESGDEAELGASIASRLSAIMAALVQNFDCSLPLTAGKDSRLLFGALLPHIDRLGSLYTMAINRLTYMDCRVARNMAWHYGVPYQAIVKGTPGFARALSGTALATTRAQMGLRTSYVWNGRDDDYARGIMLAPKSALTLRGALCEITRANKYRRPLPSGDFHRDYAFSSLLEMKPEDAAKSFHPDRLTRLRDLYETWADGVPDAQQSRLIDLAHCELWSPSVVNPAYYAFTNSFFMNPFNDRELIGMSMRVPPGLRKNNAMVNAILNACDPGLTDAPFLHAYIRLIDKARDQGINPLKL